MSCLDRHLAGLRQPLLQRLRGHGAALALSAVACFGAASAAASPQAGAPAQQDGVAHLLHERGLIDTQALTSSPLVQQVRDRASALVLSAVNFLGVPYRRGGNSAEDGFDCSGFTRYVFDHSLGLVLPRRADEQAKAPGLLWVKREELKPGDLVFFNTLKRSFSHVGIYVGEGKFIHAPRTGAQVRIEDMRKAYWAKRFTGARRAEAAALLPIGAALSSPSAADRDSDADSDSDSHLARGAAGVPAARAQ